MEKKIEDYKAIIIKGINEKNEDGANGKVELVGHVDDYDFHTGCLIDYGLENYPDVQVFKIIPNNCEPDVPIYFLTVFNNIVYINVSSGNYGKRGILFFPDEISIKQKEELHKLSEKLSNVNLDIVYDMYFDDGLVYSQEFDCKRGHDFKYVLDDFFNSVSNDELKIIDDVKEKKPR